MAVGQGGCLYAGISLAAPETPRLAQGRVAAYTHQSPARDSGNEDSLAVIPVSDDTVVLAVADGLGGGPAGELASRLAVESLRDSVAAVEWHRLREAILTGIEQANRQILALGNGAATTLAVAELRGRVLRTYHVGDAAALVTGQRGRLRLQTVAHSPVGYAIEAGLLNEEDAMLHPDRNLVSNVVGSRDMSVEMGPLLKLAVRDTVLVASDGLFDNFLPGEIAARVRCGPLDRVSADLAGEARERMLGQMPGGARGHPDDLSFILYRP